MGPTNILELPFFPDNVYTAALQLARGAKAWDRNSIPYTCMKCNAEEATIHSRALTSRSRVEIVLNLDTEELKLVLRLHLADRVLVFGGDTFENLYDVALIEEDIVAAVEADRIASAHFGVKKTN
jgi:hypothetical protein